ncbi:glycosyltransferase [Natrarchaeobius halalkaliphilus]|uniref:Glycosyltransferase n=1 Tax=Natrarchaeobius halalkaliphilus TaxID=1679091 RepID=A0A3N6P9T5_9EURY|nr:glycosyltransferase [Natrarchaeobius halalkaliphilus]RQG93045.1 glycosyltransferase [Natrarchaeobius halalkaliphilus]
MVEATFFTHNLGVGGAQRVLVNLSTELAKRGREIEIVVHTDKGKLASEVHDDVNIYYTNTPNFVPTIRSLRSYLRDRHPDVLLSTVNIANLAAIIAGKTTNTDTHHVVRMANTPSKKAQDYENKQIRHKVVPYMMRGLYPLSDEILAVSAGLKDDLVQSYGIDPSKIRVIYNPTVTQAVFEKAEQPVDHRWLDDPSQDVILGVGSLIKQKDFETLIKSFCRVQQRIDAKLLILGKGNQRDALGRLVQDLGLTSQVDLYGAVANPYSYMANADLFVLSSRWEGCPNVLIEAMACDTPVVSTDCPNGPREILRNGEYGPLVPMGDSNTMATAIVDQLENTSQFSNVKDRAMDFHVNVIADEYEKLLFGDA